MAVFVGLRTSPALPSVDSVDTVVFLVFGHQQANEESTFICDVASISNLGHFCPKNGVLTSLVAPTVDGGGGGTQEAK